MGISKQRIAIKLNEAEQNTVRIVAALRLEYCKRNGYHSNLYPNTVTDESIEIEGLGAEFAFCRMVNAYPCFITTYIKGQPDAILSDRRTVDVKWTKYPYGPKLQLLVRVDKKAPGDADIYALMTGAFPNYVFEGYATDEMVFAAPIRTYGAVQSYGVDVDKLLPYKDLL